MSKKIMARGFVLILVALALYTVYRLFEPFLMIIIASTMLASIFYRPYRWMVKRLRGRKRIAAFLMCILIALLVIIPVINIIVYAGQEAGGAYDRITGFIKGIDLGALKEGKYWERFNALNISGEDIEEAILSGLDKLRGWVISGAGTAISSTTNFLFSVLMIFFTMYYFFIEGDRMLKKIMSWTPLPNKYDEALFVRFREVSYTSLISTLVIAVIQGVLGALSFLIVGMPAFLPGLAMGFLSLMPVVGASIVWIPIGVYLLVAGQLWQGIFILAFGAVVISSVDNLLRPMLMQGKTKINTIFLIFSILGGISLFGFWGAIFGPIVLSLAATVMHIYEMEFKKELGS